MTSKNEGYVSTITQHVADSIGDMESAENFVKNFDQIPINTVRDRYVVSPVYWIVMSLLPEDFAAHAPSISLYLSSLIRDLMITKSNAETELAIEKAKIASLRVDADAATFLARKDKGESDKVASIHSKRRCREFDDMDVRVSAKYKSVIDECSANIQYATSCLFAVKDFVASMREIESIRGASAGAESLRAMLRAFMDVPDPTSLDAVADEVDGDDALDTAPSGSTKHAL